MTVSASDSVPPEVSLEIPAVGTHHLRILSPTVLELEVITRVPQGGRPQAFDFAPHGTLDLPAPSALQVTAQGKSLAIAHLGFRQRPLYAPVKTYDLRVRADLYVTLSTPLQAGTKVSVKALKPSLLGGITDFTATFDERRPTPIIHVDQQGYPLNFSKKAYVGYYLGSLGEMPVSPTAGFELLDSSGAVAFRGILRRRQDQGSQELTAAYSQVCEADFTSFRTPGTYRVYVPDLGVSLPFVVGDEAAGSYARAYALGLYHQRCGAENALPFTRFTHAPCHVKPAQVPTMASLFAATNGFVKSAALRGLGSSAPLLVDVATSLMPFVRQGELDTHGGHHDAGDYSKYTIDSALLVHYLCFAVDNFPGVAALDNLGLPESGNGKSDLLELAMHEADYLVRIQDADGGISAMVYPRDERYEATVLPDAGVPQVLWPKTSNMTAAAVACLAQLATSPTLRVQFPLRAAAYETAARKGYQGLQTLWARHGRKGSYQQLTQYGSEFGQADEIVWMEIEMYLLTHDPAIHQQLLADLDPTSAVWLRWGWWRLYENVGCAMRDYAFAARSGRVPATALDPALLSACEQQVRQAGYDQLSYAQNSAYGVSYALPDKAYGSAAWFTPGAQTWDLLVAHLLQPDSALVDAVLSNVHYENGANPVNQMFVTGQGYNRQHEIVSQFANNDRRRMPPSGIPLGALVAHPLATPTYGQTLSELCFPQDTTAHAPYPIYDRYIDTWNVETEIVTQLAARSLGPMAWLMAQSSLAHQAYRALPARLEGGGEVRVGTPVHLVVRVSGQDFTKARVVWEVGGKEVLLGGGDLVFTPDQAGSTWVEAEVEWPDGRRAFASLEMSVAARP